MPRTLWGAGGVSRYRSPVATPQHWLRRGAFPHCFGVHLLHRAGDPHGRSTESRGCTSEPATAGRACDRRHVEQARSPAARSHSRERYTHHSESGPAMALVEHALPSPSSPVPTPGLVPPSRAARTAMAVPIETGEPCGTKIALSQTRDVPV